MKAAPSLLDRLVDLDPVTPTESAAAGNPSLRAMRKIIRRDLIWLLTTIRLSEVEDLSAFPNVSRSVLDYGVRDLSGVPEKNLDPLEIARSLRKAVIAYEPRLDPDSIQIEVLPFDDDESRGVAKLDILATWANDLYDEPVHVEAVIDFETGGVEASSG